MLDTILFDNWNTLAQAPELMKSGASVQIFLSSLRRHGLEADQCRFTEVYRSVAKKQVAKAEAEGWTEIDYMGRIVEVIDSLGVPKKRGLTLAKMAWRDYMEEWLKQTTLYPETSNVIEDLRGSYRLGVVTNFMDGSTARHIFRKLRYESWFESIVISAEVGYMKPSPIIFRKALMELASEPNNCVMVGDSYAADVVGARCLGMKGILIDQGSASDEQREGSDAVISGIGSFPEALKSIQGS
jgi:HAD superfamily hydrolase (TIGR01549 family)